MFIPTGSITLKFDDIRSFANDFDITSMVYKDSLYFYLNQPLLDNAATYMATKEGRKSLFNKFPIKPDLDKIFILKAKENLKYFLTLFYANENETRIEFFQMKLKPSAMERSETNEEEVQATYTEVQDSMSGLKELLNQRKKKIGQMKSYLDQERNSTTAKRKMKFLRVRNGVISDPSNKLGVISIAGQLKASPDNLLKQTVWTNIQIEQLRQSARSLLYKNRENVLNGDMVIKGNLTTKTAKMRRLRASDRKRSLPKRSIDGKCLKSPLTVPVVNAKSVQFNGKLFKNLLLKSQRRISVPVHIKNLYTNKMTIPNNLINNISLKDAFKQKSKIKTRIRGVKTFKRISTKLLKATNINHVAFHPMVNSYTEYMVGLEAPKSKPLHLEGRHEIGNLVIKNNINRMNWKNFTQSLFLTDKNNRIKGNLILKAKSNIRNLVTKIVNGISTENLFTLSTDQIVKSNIFIHKLFTNELNVDTVNDLKFSEKVAILGESNFINCEYLKYYKIS